MANLRWSGNAIVVMYKSQIILILILSFGANFSMAQKENNQWIVGDYGDSHNFLDFNTGSPVVDSVFSTCSFFLTNASICDSTGQLQFYTNGHVVYNRNNDSLQNTSGINPGWATTHYIPNGMGIPQGAFIIPRPGHYGQYILFYESAEYVILDSINTASPINLGYSIINMDLDGGLGGIDSSNKNRIAINDTLTSGRITGVKHANGRDWWIIKHHYDDDKYYTILVTPDSILGPFSQNIGRPHVYEGHIMQSCFSQQGDKFIMILTEDLDSLQTIIDLFDFDRCNGMLSNQRAIVIPDTQWVAIGSSFSPNGRFLYINTNKDLYQFDTWNTSNINSTRLVVSSWDTTQLPYREFYHQYLTPEGKILITNWFSSLFLNVINQPDSQGTACSVSLASISLPYWNSFMLPNAANYSLGPITGSVCDSLTPVIEITPYDFQFQFMPNPNNGMFSISYRLPQNKDGKLEIHNAIGGLLYSQPLPPWSSFQKLNLQGMKPGLYFISISSINTGKIVARIVVIEQ